MLRRCIAVVAAYLLTSVAGTRDTSPRWSPDGRTLALSSTTTQADLDPPSPGRRSDVRMIDRGVLVLRRLLAIHAVLVPEGALGGPQGFRDELSRSGEPWHRVERLRHILGWMDRWLGPSS